MNRKFLVSASVAVSLIALTCYAAVTTVTGSRILASFVKEMHNENAVIVCSDSPASSLPAGIVTNVTKATGAITASGTISVPTVTNLYLEGVEVLASATINVTVTPQFMDLSGTNVMTNVLVTASLVSNMVNVMHDVQPQTLASAPVGVTVVGGGAVVTNVTPQVTP